MDAEELHKKYGFDKDMTPEQWAERVKVQGHGLNPVYKKHLPAAWILQNIWGLYSVGEISSGKARELSTAVIEEHLNNISTNEKSSEKSCEENSEKSSK